VELCTELFYAIIPV